jgi:hypothetical protein
MSVETPAAWLWRKLLPWLLFAGFLAWATEGSCMVATLLVAIPIVVANLMGRSGF